MADRQSLEQAIAALEAQRAVLGDEVLQAALAPLREKLTSLNSSSDEQQPQRRLVTALFADVTDFTAMSEQLDPEDVNEIMNSLWQILDDEIAQHGGMIDKHFGDGVLAFWGADIAREDDPERAIRAALAMQQVVAHFDVKVEELIDRLQLKGFSPNLDLRIGVNTGPVLFSKVGLTGEYTAIGDAVNTAQRLQQAAPVGGVLISHATYRHVRGVFEVNALDPVNVKGKHDPLRVYLVDREKPRAFRLGTRGVEDVETRMVGRAEELALLKDILQQTVKEHRPGLVTITGEAGVGKSRLLYEFDTWLELIPQWVRYFKGRANQHTQHKPFGVIRDMLSASFEIQDSDAMATVREKLVRGFQKTWSDRDDLHERACIIGYLLGFELGGGICLGDEVAQDGADFQTLALSYLTDYFIAVAAQNPVLILLEDLHWADESSLKAIESLLTALPHRPIMVACTARQPFLQEHSRWGKRHSGSECICRHISLERLSKTDSQRLVDEILQKVERVPDALRSAIVNHAEGNPYYIEEFIKMLIEEGIILKGHTAWHIELSRLDALPVPPTLTELLQSRLDRLPPSQKRCLQYASVIGRVFWSELVGYLDKMDEESAQICSLEPLVTREMIFPRKTSAFADSQEFIFKNVLLREVVYESVLKSKRRSYHARVAERLVAKSGDRMGEYAGLVADHWELAGRPGEALKYLRRAGEQAFSVNAYREALSFFERAMELAGDDDTERMSLALQSGRALQYLGDYPEATAYLREALQLANQAGDRLHRAATLEQLGEVASNQGDFARAHIWLEQSLDLAREVGDRARIAHSLVGLGFACYREGDFARAQELFDESLSLYRELDDQSGMAYALLRLGTVATSSQEYEKANFRLAESLAIYRELRDRRGESLALNNLGENARLQKDYLKAQSCYESSMLICRDIGNRLGFATLLGNLGHLAVSMGRKELARSYYREGMRAALAIQAVPVALDCLVGVVGVMAQQFPPAQTLEWLGFALNHPSLLSDTVPTIQSLIKEMKGHYPAEETDQALSRGQALHLDEVVSQLTATQKPLVVAPAL